jgi:carbon storage regulator CsrA
MLILPRNLGEKIISNNITMQVASISNGVVRLRIVAPKEVLVLCE